MDRRPLPLGRSMVVVVSQPLISVLLTSIVFRLRHSPNDRDVILLRMLKQDISR